MFKLTLPIIAICEPFAAVTCDDFSHRKHLVNVQKPLVLNRTRTPILFQQSLPDNGRTFKSLTLKTEARHKNLPSRGIISGRSSGLCLNCFVLPSNLFSYLYLFRDPEDSKFRRGIGFQAAWFVAQDWEKGAKLVDTTSQLSSMHFPVKIPP